MDSTSPSASSLDSLIRLHPRERLFVHPLQWTSRHLELLQCSFEESDQPLAPVTSIHPPDPSWEPRTGAVRRLGQSNHYANRKGALESILRASGHFTVRSSEGLRFMFAQRRIKTRLPCAVFSFQDKDKENMDYYFAGAYMKRHSLQFARKSSLHFPIWFRRTNEPCEGLRSLQLKKLTPQQSLHDPCIVAALVALARLQRIRPYQGSAPISHGSTTTFKPFLVFDERENEEHIHLFTAEIPSSFLDRFDFPALPYSAPQSISIQHAVIPYEPHETFASRLLTFLFPALAQEKQETGVQSSSSSNGCTNPDNSGRVSGPMTPDSDDLDEKKTAKIVETGGEAILAEPGRATREHFLEPQEHEPQQDKPQEEPLEVSRDLEARTEWPNLSSGSPLNMSALKRKTDQSDHNEQEVQLAAKRARLTKVEGDHDHQPYRSAGGAACTADSARTLLDTACSGIHHQWAQS